ncbi:hypothetical protein VP01_6011g1 [Puccinia sorghi]|uniref:Uncharacterized protein n=1 Tax=Puccinia sorghi TaxID=27349 RepID=A0A0L6UJH8_9BASI|nr:hypothetical protein VP01_6011g1 [Puccinia sorghi]
MVSVCYALATNFAVVRLLLQSHSQTVICDMLAYSVSHQSLSCWLNLYETNQCVMHDPDTYKQQGCCRSLSAEDLHQGTLLSWKAIHNNLLTQMCITLKKADTINIQKCMVAKFLWVERMKNTKALCVIVNCSEHLFNQLLVLSIDLSSANTQNVSVREDLYNCKEFEHFLNYNLVSAFPVVIKMIDC